MKLYKLTDAQGRTRNNTHWGEGITVTAKGEGTTLCSTGVVHAYTSLLLAELLDKSHRFTDWTRRPLSDAQMTYALSDVTHLRDVYRKLAADLDKRRNHWKSATA